MSPKKQQTNASPPSTNISGLIDHTIKVIDLIQYELELNPNDTRKYQPPLTAAKKALMDMRGDEIQEKIKTVRDNSIISESDRTNLEYDSMCRKFRVK